MNYEKHLLTLIKKRNERELMFKDIINDYNDIYQKSRQLEKKNKLLQQQNEELSNRLHDIEEMTKITIHKKGIEIDDNYF